MGPKPKESLSIREDNTQRLREEGHEKTEAEIEVMLPRAEDHMEPQEAGRGKEGSSPIAFGGSGPANTLISDFWAPEL